MAYFGVISLKVPQMKSLYLLDVLDVFRCDLITEFTAGLKAYNCLLLRKKFLAIVSESWIIDTISLNRSQ